VGESKDKNENEDFLAFVEKVMHSLIFNQFLNDSSTR
jgi:hypothetical protein